MKRHLVQFTFILVISAISILAMAQEERPTPEDQTAALKEVQLPNIPDPDLTGSVAKPSVDVIFEASKDDKRVEARIGFLVNGYSLDLRLGGPTSKSSSRTVLADLDGLANDTSAELKFTRSVWNPKIDLEAKEKVCDKYLKTFATKDEKDQELCVSDAIKKTPLRREWLSATKSNQVILFGAGAKVGQQEFKFVSRDDLSKDLNEAHTDYSFSAYVGLLTNSNYFVGGNFRSERAYQADDPSQVCVPFGSSGALLCKEVILGAPVRKNKEVGQVEFKSFLTDRLAVGPRLSRDFKNDVTSFELPVYFLQNKADKGLNGGATLGWRSDTDDWTIQIFVGGNFGIL